LSRPEVEVALGVHAPRLGEALAQVRVVEPDYTLLESFLSYAVEQGMDVFELLGSTAFVVPGGNCALLLRRGLLEQMDADFDLHTLFAVDAPRKNRSKPPLHLQFLLVANGQMFVSYDGSARVFIEEYDRGPSTGSFRFEPLIGMQIDADGLDELRVFKSIHARPTALKGPFGTRILKIEKVADGRVQVRLKLLFTFNREMPLAAISRRQQD